MRKRYVKTISRRFSIILAVLMTLSIVPLLDMPAYAENTVPKHDELKENSASRHIVCEALSEAGQDYYKGDYAYSKLLELPGASDSSDSYIATKDNQLYSALQNLMQSTLNRDSIPKYKGYDENSITTYWNYTDTCPEMNDSKELHFILFYSDVLYERPGNIYTMNREHVWPKSHGSFHQTNAGSDLHHLRPSVEDINNAKGEHTFGYVDEIYSSGYDVEVYDGIEVYKLFIDHDVFEPKDDVKGDIARILLYVYCCWGQPNLYSDVALENLPPFDPDDSNNNGGRVITDLDTLLSWCEEDPVDTWEMERNDIAQMVQGNRNVFIDYPELAWRLFDRQIPYGMQTPTNIGCNHVWETPVIKEATCTENGEEKKICSVCGNVNTKPLPILGHTDDNNDKKCDRCGKEFIGPFVKTDDISGYDQILFFNPATSKAISTQMNSSNKLNGERVELKDGEIIPTEDDVVFQLESAGEKGYYLKYNDKYLSCSEDLLKLVWNDTKSEYSIWQFNKNSDGNYNIVNYVKLDGTKTKIINYFYSCFAIRDLVEGDETRDTLSFQFFVLKDSKQDDKPSPDKDTSQKKLTNTLKIKARTVTVKYSKLKKRNQKLKITKAIRFKNKGQGKLTYKKVKGNRKITINKKTGKITIKKGLKKGRYKLVIKVKAAGNNKYKASAAKKVTVTIKVK